MANNEQPAELPQPFSYIGWSAEDLLTLTDFVLLESFQNLQDEACLSDYVREMWSLREKVAAADVQGFFFSEEDVTLLGIFVHTRSLPKEGLHKLLF